MLIENMTGPFVAVDTTGPSNVIDLMEALQKSLELSKHSDDIVNIGLHFILKNVRPYAASCSEA